MLPVKTLEFGSDIPNVQIDSRFLRTIRGESFIKNKSNKFDHFCWEKQKKSFEMRADLCLR